MKELESITVEIRPAYFLHPSGQEDQELQVKVIYRGREYTAREHLWQSDAISVLDYCFDRARNAIKDMIDKEATP